MKKLFTLIGILALATIAAQAQETIREKIKKAHADPKTAEKAAIADDLLLNPRRWRAGRTTMPVSHSIVAPDPKPKQ